MRLFRRQKTPEPEEASATPETSGPPQPARARWGRPRSSRGDPLAQDEAWEPLTMEIVGSRHFTVIAGPMRKPGARPPALPPVPGERRRGWLPWRRRPDLLTAMPAPAAVAEAPPAAAPPRQLPWQVRGGVLLTALAMLGIAALGVAGGAGLVPPAMADLVPLGLVVVGILMLPWALRRPEGGRLPGSLAPVAVGVGALLAQNGPLPFAATLSAVLLIAFGAAVVIRGMIAAVRAEDRA